MSLDIATKTGWALAHEAGAVTHGTESFPSDLAEFAFEFDKWLTDVITRQNVGTIYVEAPLPVNRKTTHNVLLRAYGAHVIARKIAYASGIKFVSVPADKWRQFFIGVSRAPSKGVTGEKLSAHFRRKWLKEAAMTRCKKLGFQPASDDVADALGLLAFAKNGERHHGTDFQQALARSEGCDRTTIQ